MLVLRCRAKAVACAALAGQQDTNPFESCRSLTDSPQHPWRFQQGALFGRLDAFDERCRCMSDAKKAAQQFGALERVEIGGTKVPAPFLIGCGVNGAAAKCMVMQASSTCAGHLTPGYHSADRTVS